MTSYCEVCGNEHVQRECYLCKERTDWVGKTNLVYTWETFEVEGSGFNFKELHQVMWHKECYEKTFERSER